MLIDFHTHIYPEKLASRTVETLGGKAHIPHFTDGTLGSLTALMDREGVDRFVLLHIATSPKNEGNVNAFARQTNSARHPSFGSVHPDSARWKEELLALKEAGVKGVKFHNEYQNFFADDEKAFPVYAECGRLGLAMLFHGGADLAFSPPEKCSPARMARAAKAFPSANFIFAHLGNALGEGERRISGAPCQRIYGHRVFLAVRSAIGGARSDRSVRRGARSVRNRLPVGYPRAYARLSQSHAVVPFMGRKNFLRQRVANIGRLKKNGCYTAVLFLVAFI